MNDNSPLPPGDSRQGRQFEKLVFWVSSFSLGVMAAGLASLKEVNPAIVFRFSAATVAAFLAGTILTALFLRLVLHASTRKRAALVVGAFILAVLGYFSFGIKNVSPDNRHDVGIGTAIAVIVLSFVAWVLWRVVHFFESDQPPEQDRPLN